ncbi:MAG TPA: ABC transporter permease, partial [Terriglobus sp.]
EGMSARDAMHAARRQFGNTTLLTQRQREGRTTMFFSNVGRDLRYGMRQLIKTPVFTIVCVLTLALGIGANTAVFSVMHAVLQKMLPVNDASKVFYVHTTGFPDGAWQTGDSNTSFSYPVYQAMHGLSGLQDVMTFTPMSNSGKAAVRVGSVAEEAAGDMVSGNYFSGLGVGTEVGRGFTPKDEQDHTQVTVISEAFWSTHYQRSADVIGKTLYIKSIPFTIVGVAKRGFEGTEGALPDDFWIPLQSRPEFNTWGSSPDNGMYLTEPRLWAMRLMVRTAPGVSRDQALAQMQTLFDRVAYTGIPQKQGGGESLKLSLPEAKQFDSNDDSLAQALKVLMAMVGLVLLIAMSNVVMLLMARNANRQREFGLRFALGAGRREIARQLLTESMLLVAMGGAVAWGFALLATRALGAWAQIGSSLQPDMMVLGVTMALLVLLALVFGLAPLRAAMSSASQSGLRSSATASQTSKQKMRAGNAVIMAQIAMCLVLLVSAGLLLKTLRNLLHTPMGQKPEGLVVFGIRPLHVHSNEQSIAFFTALQQKLRVLPGVTSVSMADNRPGSGWSSNRGGLLLDGHNANGLTADQVHYRQNTVAADYFHTMGVTILEGRDFTDADTATAPMVAVVNETFAKKYVGSLHAVGHVLSTPRGGLSAQIVGVVEDHKYTSIMETTRPMLWMVYTQQKDVTQMHVEMRVVGEPMSILPEVRRVVAQMDPDVPLLEPATQVAVFEKSISQQIMFARLAGCFGVLAVVLIATGLYGTLAYRMSQRKAEIGVRMALGAQRTQVVWMVLRGSLLLCVGGVLLGIPLAFVAGRGLESSLYGMKALDVTSYLFAITGVALVALLASAVPARRAASVDPLEALRAE